ncbi:MAG: hypothetical protein EP319_09615 [Deltaproteobacteria bacterium]|nr:MAG: hypothetical protein EP319_09615 [Deltaproteobacteria bacterium]
MNFSLGYIKNDNQFLLRQFGGEERDRGKLMDLEELKDAELNGLIYSENFLTEDNKPTLFELIRFFPLRKGEEFALSHDAFADLDDTNAQKIYSKMNEPWVLGNNLSLLEELFKVINHLKKLYPNERTAFFEELWFILKSNLGATDLTIVYNDIELAKKETEKNKLIRVKVEGSRNPNPVSGGEVEDKLMAHYENEFNQVFNVSEYDPHKGELVLTASINNSPVLVMAKINQLTRLQKALMNSLFEGLQNHN